MCVAKTAGRSIGEIDWIENQVDHGGDEKVITFIGDIIFHPGENVDRMETIRRLFEDGYCYYFAKMLEDAFPGGTICLCFPFGHIVYLYNKEIYDVSGKSDAEYEELVPIEAFGDDINVFRHVEGLNCPFHTLGDLTIMKDKWIESHGRIVLD